MNEGWCVFDIIKSELSHLWYNFWSLLNIYQILIVLNFSLQKMSKDSAGSSKPSVAKDEVPGPKKDSPLPVQVMYSSSLYQAVVARLTCLTALVFSLRFWFFILLCLNFYVVVIILKFKSMGGYWFLFTLNYFWVILWTHSKFLELV